MNELKEGISPDFSLDKMCIPPIRFHPTDY